MNKYTKVNSLICSAVIFTSLLAGCNANFSKSTSDSSSTLSNVLSSAIDDDFDSDDDDLSSDAKQLSFSSGNYGVDVSSLFSERDLSGSYDDITAEISLNGSSVTADGNGVKV